MGIGKGYFSFVLYKGGVGGKVSYFLLGEGKGEGKGTEISMFWKN
jgi:hypothetical protein